MGSDMRKKVLIDWESKVLSYPPDWSAQEIYWSYLEWLDEDYVRDDMGGPYIGKSVPVDKVSKLGARILNMTRDTSMLAIGYPKFDVFGSVYVYSQNPDWDFRAIVGDQG